MEKKKGNEEGNNLCEVSNERGKGKIEEEKENNG